MTTTYATYWYASAHTHAWGGVTANETTYFIDYLTDTIKVSLHTNTYAGARHLYALKADK
jgi:hypothetical protein